MNTAIRLTCSLIVLHAVVVIAEPVSWDGWRGPGRDAEVRDFKPPSPWPQNLERLWRVEVGGGYSSPLVQGNRIYQQARLGGREVLVCLDATTGEVIWRAGMPVPFRPGGGGERHGPGPKSTPTLADGRIFSLSITGTLTAWQMTDGKILWQRDFRERFEKAHPYWGTATSPLVEGGRLFAHVGSCEDGALFCLAPETGSEIWVQDQHANCYSSPIVEEVDGVRQFIEFNHHGLCGVDLENGEILWEYPFPHRGRNQNTPTPIFCDGLFIVGAEDRGMFAVRARRIDNRWTAELAWEHRDVSLDMSSPVVCDGMVYGFSQFKSGQFFCLDPASGKVLWLSDPRMGDNAALLAVPGHILALTDVGELHVLRANPQACDMVRSYSVGEDGTWTAPALVDNALLIKDGNYLSRWRIPEATD